MNKTSFHELEGQNIYFKSLSISDAQEVHDYASDPDVSRFIGWRLMHTLDETSKFIEEMIRRDAAGTHLYASIVLKSTKKSYWNSNDFQFRP